MSVNQTKDVKVNNGTVCFTKAELAALRDSIKKSKVIGTNSKAGPVAAYHR